LARAAAESGLRVLVVELDGRPGVAGLLGGTGTLGYDEITFESGLGPSGTGSITARGLVAATALVDYLDAHGMRRVSKRLVSSGVVDVVSTAAPGLDDLLILGKIKQLERSGAADLVVVDGPAAGHAISFLMAAAGLHDAVRVGPINSQAQEVLDMLRDHERCQVVLVTIPEETPVNETIETAFALEDRVGVQLGPVVVNAFDLDGLSVPDPESLRPGPGVSEDDVRALQEAAQFRRRRAGAQLAQADRLAADLPLPQVRLPAVFSAGLSAADVGSLVSAMRASHGEGGAP
jgi:anion-transporting  ArsA/GET3 family ATPase